MTQARTGTAIFRVYQAFVAAMVACYVLSALLPALLVHLCYVGFALSYGQIIMAWIFD